MKHIVRVNIILTFRLLLHGIVLDKKKTYEFAKILHYSFGSKLEMCGFSNYSIN